MLYHIYAVTRIYYLWTYILEPKKKATGTNTNDARIEREAQWMFEVVKFTHMHAGSISLCVCRYICVHNKHCYVSTKSCNLFFVCSLHLHLSLLPRLHCHSSMIASLTSNNLANIPPIHLRKYIATSTHPYRHIANAHQCRHITNAHPYR